ncbi:hypothetical protein ACVWXO_002783 [Bradyrhizobium sp. LM2.7]
MQPITATLSSSTPGYFVFQFGISSRNEILDRAGQLLEGGRGGTAAAGAGCNQRHEGAETHGLQQFLADLHLAGAVAAGLRRQRDADGVADSLLQENAERGRRGDDALGAHAGLGEAKMDGVVGARREILIDRNQILHGRNLRRQDDAVLRHTEFFGASGRQQRRLHHRLARDRAHVARIGRRRILVHQLGQELS